MYFVVGALSKNRNLTFIKDGFGLTDKRFYVSENLSFSVATTFYTSKDREKTTKQEKKTKQKNKNKKKKKNIQTKYIQ